MTQRLIFLRGLARETGHWGPFRDLLLDQYPSSQIEFLDTAGNGTESSRASFLDVREYTDDLRARSQFILNGYKPVVVGVSMGGMIAAEWAHRYPNELGGVILINTSFGSTSDPWQRLRPEVILRLLKIGKSRMLSQPFEAEIATLRMISNQKMSFKKKWAHYFHTLPRPSLLNFTRQLMACSRFLGSRLKPEVPSLILASQKDRMVSYQCSESIQAFWRVPFHLHPWAGHDLPFDDAEWTLNKIEAFLNHLDKVVKKT